MLRSTRSREGGHSPLRSLKEGEFYYTMPHHGGTASHAGLHGGRKTLPLELWHQTGPGSSSSNISPPQLLPKMMKVAATLEDWPSIGMGLLIKLSAVLTDKAQRRNQQQQPALSLSLPSPLGGDAFLHPAVELQSAKVGRKRLATLSEQPYLCMEYHKGRVNQAKGIRFDQGSLNDTYLEVCIGRSTASDDPVYEWGHRVVAWCFFGPEGQEVMHTCHNPKCMSPLHLKYGTHAENMRGVAERRRQQRRKHS